MTRKTIMPALAAAAVVAGGLIAGVTSYASEPRPNIVRLVRVGEGRWEGTACWPADGGTGPHCFKTVMVNWEPTVAP